MVKMCIPLIFFSLIWMLINLYYGQTNAVNAFIVAIRDIFWFISAIIVFQFIGALIHHKFNDSVWIYIILIIATMCIPVDKFASIFFIYPFFVIGYICNKYNFSKYYIGHKKIIIPVTICLYLIMLFFYNYESYIYTSGYCIIRDGFQLHNLFIDIYRFFIGMMGSAFVMIAISPIYNKIPTIFCTVCMTLSKYSMFICNSNGLFF